MLCRSRTAVNLSATYAVAVSLPCKSWTCPECRERRSAALVMQAASGNPNRLVTLTIDPKQAGTTEDRALAIARAWKLIVKRWRRQLKRPATARWTDKQSSTTAATLDRDQRRSARDTLAGNRTIDYLAVFERHKSGEPHLHILVRGPYLPQWWLSATLQELIGSPICDVRKIDDTGRAARYISKYISKDPHKFGKLKRYWQTPNYAPDLLDPDNPFALLPRQWTVEREPIEEIYQRWSRSDRKPILIDDNYCYWGDIPGRLKAWLNQHHRQPKREHDPPSRS